MCSVMALGTEVRGLAEGLDELAALDASAMADAELSETLVALSRLRSRLEGIEARLTAVWDARQVWADDHAKSGAAWLSQRCRIPIQAARARVRLARRLRRIPRTEEALVQGDIGTAHAERLGTAASRAPEAFARDEALLVEHAKTLRFADFHRALAYWEQLADPDGVEKDAKAHDLSRSLYLSQTLGGTWVLDGVGDAIGGTIVAEVLSRIEDELFEADWATAKAELGDAVTPQDLARTSAQRRFDALVEMAKRAAAVPEGARMPRPLFSVLIDYPSLSGRVLELANGTVVTPGQLVPWLSEADVERVVLDGPSRVIDVGVRQRLFKGATRRAVEVRDRFCTGFACDEPAERCDVDHIQPHADGGPTTQSNGRLRCPPHNPGRRTQRRWPGPDPP